MSERVLNEQEMQALRIDLAAAEYQLHAAFDAMDFDPHGDWDEDAISFDIGTLMRLAAVGFNLFCARKYVEPIPSATEGSV